MENLLEKAQRLGIKPANVPSVPTSTGSVNLLEKAQRLGIQPANKPQTTPQKSWLDTPVQSADTVNAGNVVQGGLGNTLKSTLKFGVNALRYPFDVGYSAGQVPSAIHSLFTEAGLGNEATAKANDSAQQLKTLIDQKKAAGQDTSQLETAYAKINGTPLDNTSMFEKFGNQLPKAALQNVSSDALQKLEGGDVQGSLKSTYEDPGQLLPYLLLLQGMTRPTEVAPTGEIKPGGILGDTGFGRGVNKTVEMTTKYPIKAMEVASRPVVAGMKGAVSLGNALARYGTSQATGMSPETISRIISNPEDFSPSAMKGFTREGIANEAIRNINTRLSDLSETGKEYKGVREAATPVNLPEGAIKDVFSKHGIAIGEDGKLTFTRESIPTTPSDRAALQSWYDTYGNDPRYTSNSFLNARKALDLRYEGKSGATQAIITDLRNTLNKTGRPQVPELERLDTKFSAEVNDLKKIKTDYFNKDGTLKDNAISKIANLSNKGRESVLNRLEQVSPGIGEKVRTLKAVEDIEAASGQKVGTYARAILPGAAGYFAGGPVGAIVSAILTSPKVATQILRGYGRMLGVGEDVLNGIIGNYENNGGQNNSPIKPPTNLPNTENPTIESNNSNITPTLPSARPKVKPFIENRIRPKEGGAIPKTSPLLSEARKIGWSETKWEQNTTPLEKIPTPILEQRLKQGISAGEDNSIRLVLEKRTSPLFAEAQKISQAKSEFINTLDKQLGKGASNVFRNNEFIKGKTAIKDINVKDFTKNANYSPAKVVEWEKRISAGERPKILLTEGKTLPNIIDGNHKLQAYKNLGFTEVPTIQAKAPNPLIAEAQKYKSPEEFVKAQTELRQYGGGLDSIAKRVNIDSIKPSQSGEDLFNETSRSYAEGGRADNVFTNKPITLKPVTSPEILPPIVVDDSGRIIDGNNRWAAAKTAGLKEIRVVTKSQLTDIFNKAHGIIKK